MDPITLNLRVGRTPAASAPTGGELSAAEIDANFTGLKNAAEQLSTEKLDASAAVALSHPADLKASPADADYWVLWDTEAVPPRWKLVTKVAMLASITSGGPSLPAEVTTPVAGQEVLVFEDGSPKRTPIDTLINEAYPATAGLWDFWYQCNFGTTTSASEMFLGTAIASGTNSTAIPTTGQAGFNGFGVFLRSSTTADGGYRYVTNSAVSCYFGSVARKTRAQFMPLTSFTGRTVRAGYHDATTIADAVDGAYFEIVGATCSAKTASNSTRTTHATTLTLSLSVAYTFDVEVNAAATEARFRVCAGNDYTAVMDVTITTNIPNTSARTFGAGIVATESSTTASDIGILYSLSIGTAGGFARAMGVYVAPTVKPSAFTDPDWSATAVATGIDVNVLNVPASGTAAVSAIQYRFNGGAPVALAGTSTGIRNLTGLIAGSSYPVQLRLVTAHGKSPWSDVKIRVPTSGATAPAAMVIGDWGLTPITGGLRFAINTLPADGGSAITALQYQLNGGTWVNFTGTGTGNRDITGLPATPHTAKVRAVNAINSAADSDTKSATPAAGSGSLTVVQAPDKAYQASNTVVERSLTAVGSGNALLVMVAAPTSLGAPTITDSAGGTWGAAVHSYAETTNGTTAYYFTRSGVTGGPTWVRATYATGGELHLGVVEVSGGTLSVDATGGATQAATTAWDHAFTSTAANTLFMGFGSLSNGTTAAGVAPVTSSTTPADYFYYARGLFPTAGANTATVNLVDSRSGAKSWLVVKG